jgi:hypothetical protein
LLHADKKETDGRTDMTKLIIAFRNFANAPKSGQFTTTVFYSDSYMFRLQMHRHQARHTLIKRKSNDAVCNTS